MEGTKNYGGGRVDNQALSMYISLHNCHLIQVSKALAALVPVHGFCRIFVSTYQPLRQNVPTSPDSQERNT